ncbi:hypothetical protein VB773_08480 [Haloarculaceae archaeon H-GB2-1]|nr:hypothetical protein [Haloarculaceae archaeon H-GB1-1]MEA5386093.1 hypothetical protein [Haloarculaceae archaeon H-GB11]MEA5407599.1 hypothetical protein [Haloarculaceae archaeon H-GB2-1]
MTLAAATRAAVDARPFLYEALRAGVVNYSAAARFIDVGDDETDAVVAALRRYAEELPAYDETDVDRRVTMESGLGEGEAENALLTVGETALVPGSGSLTGLLATGDVDAGDLRRVLGRLETADVSVVAAGVAGDALLVVVERRAGADALRLVESA